MTVPASTDSTKGISVPESLRQGVYGDRILVNGVDIEWDTKKGTCTFRGIPVALMWVDSTLAGLMAGVASMVGPDRFTLALQSEGRKSVESDWLLISSFPDFREGFAALNLNAAVAAWGDWQLIDCDMERKLCVFRAYNNWEGMYQKSLGVCWGSGMLAGKFSGICSKLFKTNCWATQTQFVAKGDAYDEFHVSPSTRTVEEQIESLLTSDNATRADMAVALERLRETEKSLRMEIAERKQAEAATDEAHRRLLAVFNGLDAIVYVADMDTYELLFVNKYVKDAFGDVEGQPCWKAIQTGQTGPCDFCTNGKLLDATGNPAPIYHWEFQNTANGRWYDIHDRALRWEDGRIVRLEIATDISERKKAEEALQEGAKRHRTILHTAMDGFWLTDAQGYLLEVNEAYCKMSGYSEQELLAMRVQDLEAAEAAAQTAVHMQRIAAQGEDRFESRHRRKNGSIVDVEISVQYRNVEDGQFVAFVQDITARKHQGEAVKRLNLELEQRIQERTQELQTANRELESFSYSVSHDLRAPLRAIEGFSSLLEKEYSEKLDERAKDYFKRVRGGATRMAVLIDDMLNLSRISRQEMHRGPVHLTALAREAAEALQAAEPERRVEWVIAPEIRTEGDSGLLRIALQNLIGNAWKYSSKREDARIEFGVCDSNGRRAYFVRDNGAGFDMTYADKLFGAFQRLHSMEEFPGTGIGLATVKRIVSRHGGQVWAESTAGEGATFYFTV